MTTEMEMVGRETMATPAESAAWSAGYLDAMSGIVECDPVERGYSHAMMAYCYGWDAFMKTIGC